jgi:hypothetical protein
MQYGNLALSIGSENEEMMTPDQPGNDRGYILHTPVIVKYRLCGYPFSYYNSVYSQGLRGGDAWRAILPAAAWYFSIIRFRFYARCAEKRKQKEIKYRCVSPVTAQSVAMPR